jgi:hypothetical protein
MTPVTTLIDIDISMYCQPARFIVGFYKAFKKVNGLLHSLRKYYRKIPTK